MFFPRWFELHFNKGEDDRVEMPLSISTTVRSWSATMQSDFLDAVPEKRVRHRLPAREDLSRLCHFDLSFHDGALDVLAEDYISMTVSK